VVENKPNNITEVPSEETKEKAIEEKTEDDDVDMDDLRMLGIDVDDVAFVRK
jgi:hypothetical protein